MFRVPGHHPQGIEVETFGQMKQKNWALKVKMEPPKKRRWMEKKLVPLQLGDF